MVGVRRRRVLLAIAGLVLGYPAVTGLLLWATGGVLAAVRAPGGAPIDAALTLGAAVAAWAVLSWLTVVTAAGLLAALAAGVGSRSFRIASALAPAAARRLVAAGLGLTLAATPLAGAASATLVSVTTAPASAGFGSDQRPDGTTMSTMPTMPTDRPVASPPPGWTPDRPIAPSRRDRRRAAVRLVATPAPAQVAAYEVVVRRGDTLWDIAARHLGPAAAAADIAADWPRWYAANRGVIGPDPDLITPGQRLRPPASR